MHNTHRTPPKNSRLDEEAAQQLAEDITNNANPATGASRARPAHYKSWGNVVDVHGPGYRIIIQRRTREVEALLGLTPS